MLTKGNFALLLQGPPYLSRLQIQAARHCAICSWCGLVIVDGRVRFHVQDEKVDLKMRWSWLLQLSEEQAAEDEEKEEVLETRASSAGTPRAPSPWPFPVLIPPESLWVET